jgi:hypothetical protein
MAGGLYVDETQMAEGTLFGDDDGVVLWRRSDESQGNRGPSAHHE